jgi:hypothetical protein
MPLMESVFARREEICIRRSCLYLAGCVPDSHVYSTEVVYRDRPRASLSRVRFPAGARTFSSKFPDLLWGSHSLLLNGYRGSLWGVKRPQLKVDHSPPSNGEVKNECSYNPTPPIRLQVMDRGSFFIPLPYSSGPGSSVSIATGYGLDGPGIESRWGVRFSAPVQTGPGTHPAPLQRVPGFYRR